ncbi:MAG TPA: diacylglycerol kinase family protein [bacterium]|jgi:diacylglycerol kinase (ATP)|nr:diacylglycerol kinase family protein [bacterium]
MTTKAPKAKKIVFLINPGAGSRAASKVRRLAPTLFPQPEWAAEFKDLVDWREIRPLARAAAKAGAWAVVAVGGDGTLNQVAQALQGSTCRLGLVPAGTGNGYARALGIPLDARGACAVIALGRVARLDFIAADSGRGYANMLGIGYDAWIASSANRLRWLNRFSGFLRYLVAGIQCLPRLRPQALRLTLDKGLVVEGRFLMVAVANSPQYGFGCTIAPAARMDDGYVDVVCVPAVAPWTFLRNCVRLFKRKALVGASFHRCRELRIESLEAQPLAVHMDGEPGGTTPVRMTVKAGALRTLVP